jgi:pseudouridylate synthase
LNRSNPRLAIQPDVAAALAQGMPVVALESTIITHGMPYPVNLETARAIEEIVRDAGAVPATIAVLEGRIRIGLARAQLEFLAGAQDVMKLSRADIAFAVANGRPGATTVAATMICAAMAGIRVFATGGIGGVHRGAESSFDVSADLEELARTPVTVVAAGAKAILDLPKTLEILETRGVPVVGFATDSFPAFWSRTSGLPAPLRLDTPEAIAALMRVREELGHAGGILVANPIPAEHEIPFAEISRHVDAALAEAARAGIAAKRVTPFLLERVAASTGGRSLASNVAIIRSNAALAARIAVAVAR